MTGGAVSEIANGRRRPADAQRDVQDAGSNSSPRPETLPDRCTPRPRPSTSSGDGSAYPHILSQTPCADRGDQGICPPRRPVPGDVTIQFGVACPCGLELSSFCFCNSAISLCRRSCIFAIIFWITPEADCIASAV